MLENTEIDGKDLQLLTNLYWNQRAAVDINQNKTEWKLIKRGVRQGCPVSPILFSFYGEIIMRSISDMEGLKVGGVNINNIRYADDTVLIADSEEKLQNLVNAVNRKSEEYGLRINKKKTETLVIAKTGNPTCNIKINNENIKQVDSFKYLGSLITTDGKCIKEVRTRIGMAKTSFHKMKALLCNLKINIKTRIKALKSYIWAVLTYGCESWTLNQEALEKLEAFEMWTLRRMMRIPWTARKTNQQVLHQAGTKKELLKQIKTRQLKFMGHCLRKHQIENLSLTGTIEGKRARGRQRHTYIQRIIKNNNMQYKPTQLIQMTEDQKRWRDVTAQVT